MKTISKFKKGNKVIFEGMPATIVDVHYYLPTKNGKKEMIWYSVRKDGFSSCYAVSEKVNHLTLLETK
jgi:translation elongation factor P/translation initiation factor 5A